MSPTVRIERTRNRHSRAVLQEETVVIRLARNLSAREEQHHIENLVRRMVKMLEQDRRRVRVDPYFAVTEEQAQFVHDRVHQINAATLNVPIHRIRLRPMRSQWGSCSSSGDITLNTALLQLPQRILDYVIVHELAHRRYSGHGIRFWNLVESAYPRAREVRKELRKYRLARLPK